MNTTLWIALISLLILAHAFLFIDYYRSRRTRLSKQQIPLISALMIGPLFYFILTNYQLKERKTFMKNKRRFS
jgi:positive regulator of sigma E activity